MRNQTGLFTKTIDLPFGRDYGRVRNEKGVAKGKGKSAAFGPGTDGVSADQLSVLEQTTALGWRIICPTASVELRNSKPDRWIWQESWGNSHEYNGNNHYL